MTVVEQHGLEVIEFEVRVQPDREAVWIEPTGELDLATAPVLEEAVQALIAVGFDQLIIDLRGLSFMDTAGVRLLLCLADHACDDGWRLSLIQGGDQVKRICMLTGTLGRLRFSSAMALAA